MTADAFPELQLPAKKLLQFPPAEPPATAQMIYGYVRASTTKPAYADACADLLTWWSVATGVRLGTVFRDHGVASTTLVRPGFTGLLDVLRLPDSAGALVIEGKHLSDTARIAKQLTADIRRTGSTVRILADEMSEVTS
jgi:DNA invertase Pin-like site-specific DNA recombinase